MKTISIPAAVNNKPGIYLERTGSATLFACFAASAVFSLFVDNQPFGSIRVGQIIGQPAAQGGRPLRVLRFENSGSTPVSVGFETSTNALTVAPIASTSPAAVPLYAYGQTSITTGATAEFLPRSTDTGHGATSIISPPAGYRRIRFQIFNMDSAESAYLQAWDGSAYQNFDIIGPGARSPIYETDDFFRVANPAVSQLDILPLLFLEPL